MSLKDHLKELSDVHFGWVRSVRRHLHQYPELSFKEYETAKFIEQKLAEIGLTEWERCAETGITGVIEGLEGGPVVALRADIDALPIQELNEVDYQSKNAACMHACGHDVHTASLLGCLKLLYETRQQWKGSIKYVFQPGEERLPGGASLMIKEGVLKNPDVRSMYGQHVMPLIEAGKVGFRSGLYMASADEIYIRVKGKGGHAAHPHQAIDPVAAAAQMIISLQQVVSRKAKPAMPSVLSFGKVQANGSTNILPDEVYLEGTFRTFDESWREEAHTWIKRIAEHSCEALGATAEVNIQKGYPHLKNDAELTKRSKQAAIELLGADKVEDLELWPAGEDFAFYSQEVDSCFYRLGIRNEHKGIVHNLHTPYFDIDEEALKTGMLLMSWLAINEMQHLSHAD